LKLGNIQIYFDQIASLNDARANADTALTLEIAKNLANACPNSAEANFLLARSYVEFGDKQQAMAFAERALALELGNVQYIYYCGFLYLEFRLYEMALPLLKRAAELLPQSYHVREDLGDCCFEIGNGTEALIHYRSALKNAPESTKKNELRLKLARAMISQGEKAEALPVLKRIARETDEFSLFALSELVTVTNPTIDSELGKQVEKNAVDESLDPSIRESLFLSLGRIYESAKEYDKAFGAWHASHELSKQIGFNLRDRAAVYEDAVRFYTPELFERTAAFASNTTKPIFIAGMPRSGTTLVEQIIGTHSEACGVGELARWTQMERELVQTYATDDYLQRITSNAQNGELKERAEELLRIFSVVASKPKSRLVEKTPHNFLNLGYFHLLCPKAKFIHIRRHPADCFISAYQNRFNSAHGYVFDQSEYVQEYLLKEKMMGLWNSLFPGQIHTIHYESLVTSPELIMRGVFEFLGLNWEPETLNFFQGKKTVRTFSMHQVRNPVNTKSIHKWKNYEKHLGELFKELKAANLSYPEF
jgi:tetratricopeptide (TPR) repeat protein